MLDYSFLVICFVTIVITKPSQKNNNKKYSLYYKLSLIEYVRRPQEVSLFLLNSREWVLRMFIFSAKRNGATERMEKKDTMSVQFFCTMLFKRKLFLRKQCSTDPAVKKVHSVPRPESNKIGMYQLLLMPTIISGATDDLSNFIQA